MKKMTIVLAMAVMVGATIGSASADMVDIGTGQMERSEFEALQAMIQGYSNPTVSSVSTVRPRTEHFGLVEMTPADFEDLRNKVAGIESDPRPHRTARTTTKMVDIGTGEMPADDFAVLKRMVKNSERIVLNKLAALHP